MDGYKCGGGENMIVTEKGYSSTAGFGSSIKTLLALTVLVLLILGCILVMWPFVTAVVWAGVLSFSTWGFYCHIRRVLAGRASLAALVMTLILASVVVVPFVIIGQSIADNIGDVIAAIRRPFEEHAQVPAWISGFPYIGPHISGYLNNLISDPETRKAQLQSLIDPLKSFAVTLGKSLGGGLAQIILSLVICFFFYRDGEYISERLEASAALIGGERGHRLLEIATITIRGVVRGFIGTAIAQGILAGLGFWIAGVPGAFLLGFLTFILGSVPFGPILLWLPAALWLFQQDEKGWAIFTIVWGVSIGLAADHLLKPILISRLGTTPLLIVMLGILGGALAFGFLGIFLGPTLLAVGYSLFEEWSSTAA
jgi:predicted PurR-regulated permease PerM